MKINPQKLRALVKKGCSQLVATSLNVVRHSDPITFQDVNNLNSFDESILQQGRFWMRTVTWTLVGSSLFGVAWLALARTEEIVVAKGQLEPIGSVQDIQMPLGGVATQILVKEGDRVKAGQVLMRLDTEASEELHNSLVKTINLKQEQLSLKQQEKRNTMQMNQEEVLMLENNLILQSEILDRYEQLKKLVRSLKSNISIRETLFLKLVKLMQKKADRLRQITLLDQQTAVEVGACRSQWTFGGEKSPLFTATQDACRWVVFDLKPTSRASPHNPSNSNEGSANGFTRSEGNVPSNKIGLLGSRKLP